MDQIADCTQVESSEVNGLRGRQCTVNDLKCQSSALKLFSIVIEVGVPVQELATTVAEVKKTGSRLGHVRRRSRRNAERPPGQMSTKATGTGPCDLRPNTARRRHFLNFHNTHHALVHLCSQKHVESYVPTKPSLRFECMFI